MTRGLRLFGQFARFVEYLNVGVLVWLRMSMCSHCVNCWLWFCKLPNTVCVVVGDFVLDAFVLCLKSVK